MATDVKTLDNVLSRLGSIQGISSKKMFGGFGIFANGNMFAFLQESALFLKADSSNLDAFVKAGSAQYRKMPYYQVPAAIFANDQDLLKWANTSVKIAQAAAKQKKG